MTSGTLLCLTSSLTPNTLSAESILGGDNLNSSINRLINF